MVGESNGLHVGGSVGTICKLYVAALVGCEIDVFVGECIGAGIDNFKLPFKNEYLLYIFQIYL